MINELYLNLYKNIEVNKGFWELLTSNISDAMKHEGKYTLNTHACKFRIMIGICLTKSHQALLYYHKPLHQYLIHKTNILILLIFGHPFLISAECDNDNSKSTVFKSMTCLSCPCPCYLSPPGATQREDRQSRSWLSTFHSLS